MLTGLTSPIRLILLNTLPAFLRILFPLPASVAVDGEDEPPCAGAAEGGVASFDALSGLTTSSLSVSVSCLRTRWMWSSSSLRELPVVMLSMLLPSCCMFRLSLGR